MNELNYIVQAILGGASGYITNDYAINMLFKEYTPLKIGGVIKKTRNEFIENLSSMVENDIINKEKLHEIFNSDEFKVEFEKLTDDFYESCLYETVGSDMFSNIDGFDSTLCKADKYVKEILNEHIGSLISLIACNFDIGCFITKSQTDKITDSVYNSIKNVFENTDTVENSLLYLYENNKDLKLSEVFDTNLNSAVESFAYKLVKIAADNAVDSKIINTVLNDAANEVLNVFYDKQIKDIVKIDGESLINSFISYIGGNDRNIIYKFCQSIFSYCRNLNKSIYSLLDPAFENNLKVYIEDNIPFVTEKAVSYVQKNSMIIDRIIEDSIDEVIKESEGFKAKLLSTVKNTYFSNLSKKYSIADKIISFIKKSTEPEKLSLNISAKIIERLNYITVGDIITEAESNGFGADKAYDMVTAFINKNGAVIIKSLENYISELRVRDIFPMPDFSAEKILSLCSVRNLLKNKSENYIESTLSKKLYNLISEDNIKFSVNKAAGYLKLKFNENEGTIKSVISEAIKKIHIDGDTLKNKEITDLAIKEAYNNYKEEAAKLKDVKLSEAADKLNSIEGISKNSSETLRKYIISNTDVILKGSIKGIVSDNLNKLSDDELIKFANDFIGRELKPIMFFGGVLGVIAGLILAVFQNSPINPGEINIANMLTYAFVGYITNVVAINMIFKPYREIKILSKIPFFRNFSLGYIIKNQKNFAKSTAHYIDSSLLSKKSINELFEKHKNNIKNSFKKNISENDYATLSNLLIKNKESTIGGTYAFLKSKVLKNLTAFGNYLYERISQIKLSSLITDKSIGNISNFVLGKLKNTENLSNNIYSVINSDKKIATLISSDFIAGILNNQTDKFYDKTINYLQPGNFKKEILKYNDRYISYVNRSLQEVFSLNDEKLSFISEKVNKIILSENFKDNASLAAVSLFNKSFDRSRTFEELFDGKVKIYLDKKMPHILKNLTDKIKESFADSKKSISATVAAELKNHLGFIERGMFSFMGGDEIIDEIITKIITDKLPKFMDVKNDEINSIITDLINEKFYKTRVDALYAKLNSLQINEMVDNYLNINKVKIGNKINNLTVELYNKTKSKNMNSILKFFYLNDLDSFVNSYDAEINTVAAVMHLNLTVNKNETAKEASSFINSVIEDFVNLKYSDIFCNVTKDNMDKIIKNITDLLFKNDDADKIIKSFIKDYKEYHNNVNLNYFIRKDEFVNSAQKFINNLLINDETEKTVKSILYSIIDDAASSNFSFIDFKSKEYIVNIFVDSSIESLRRNLDEILKSVEFDKIAAEEIEKMEPEKIHQMFNSFGEKYFRKLMLYGFGGFVFGINMYVGFALTGLKIISEIFGKDR